MNIELDRIGLETLVKGSQPDYNYFSHPLIKKAGHYYSDQHGISKWDNLRALSDYELYDVYILCRKNKN